MNNDPGGAGREGGTGGGLSGSGRSQIRHSGHFWIQQILVLEEGERDTQQGPVGRGD